MLPETRYARSGDVNIAYQVVGQGPFDLVYIPGFVSNMELNWRDARFERFFRRLASFSRLITFDKRGTGLSDRVSVDALPTLELRMDDVRAVMDSVGSERAALLGVSEGGGMSILFAATYPERTIALALFGVFAKRVRSPDYPWAPEAKAREKEIEWVERMWGTEESLGDMLGPDATEAERRSWASHMRLSASPAAAAALLRMNTAVDVRHVLPAIRVPTIVMNRTHDSDIRVEEGRWIASQILGARFFEFPGAEHIPWMGDAAPVIEEIEAFLTGVRRGPDPDRVLATVLFTDIVGSTTLAARLGDRAWADLLERHEATVREELVRFRGREVDAAGDGFLATFDGPRGGPKP